jgi:hypothetical protein
MLGVFVSARSALEQLIQMPIPGQPAGRPKFGHVVPASATGQITSMISSVLARSDNQPSDDASPDRHPSRAGAFGIRGWRVYAWEVLAAETSWSTAQARMAMADSNGDSNGGSQRLASTGGGSAPHSHDPRQLGSTTKG